MSEWEYKVVTVPRDGKPWQMAFGPVLAEMGHSGWELVCAVPGYWSATNLKGSATYLSWDLEGSSVVLYFKRST